MASAKGSLPQFRSFFLGFPGPLEAATGRALSGPLSPGPCGADAAAGGCRSGQDGLSPKSLNSYDRQSRIPQVCSQGVECDAAGSAHSL